MGIVHCPYCGRDIEAPEIATIDPDAEPPKLDIWVPSEEDYPNCSDIGKIARLYYLETVRAHEKEGWKRVVG